VTPVLGEQVLTPKKVLAGVVDAVEVFLLLGERVCVDFPLFLRQSTGKPSAKPRGPRGVNG